MFAATKSKQVPLKKTSPLKSATNAIRSTQAIKKSWIQKAELKDSKKDTNKNSSGIFQKIEQAVFFYESRLFFSNCLDYAERHLACTQV